MLFAIFSVLAGLALLTWGADRFVTGAAGAAYSLGISPLVIGLTIVGTATSAPEVLVGTVAALEGKTDIAIGNAIGSNIANIGLVLGVTVLFKPIAVQSSTLRHEYLLMVAACMTAVILMFNGELSRDDGVLLLTVLAVLIVWIVWLARHPGKGDPLVSELAREFTGQPSPGKSMRLLLIGLLFLLAGAELLVYGAVYIARAAGISELVIGLTIIAIGTSLPELAASVVSVLKNEADIAIGNVIGSNMFNMLMVLGIPCIIHPAQFQPSVVIFRDAAVMLLLVFMMGAMLFYHSKNEFDRKEGAILLLCFVTYQVMLFHTSLST